MHQAWVETKITLLNKVYSVEKSNRRSYVTKFGSNVVANNDYTNGADGKFNCLVILLLCLLIYCLILFKKKHGNIATCLVKTDKLKPAKTVTYSVVSPVGSKHSCFQRWKKLPTRLRA